MCSRRSSLGKGGRGRPCNAAVSVLPRAARLRADLRLLGRLVQMWDASAQGTVLLVIAQAQERTQVAAGSHCLRRPASRPSPAFCVAEEAPRRTGSVWASVLEPVPANCCPHRGNLAPFFAQGALRALPSGAPRLVPHSPSPPPLLIRLWLHPPQRLLFSPFFSITTHATHTRSAATMTGSFQGEYADEKAVVEQVENVRSH